MRDVYAKYVPAMGREPVVMQADYEQAVRNHKVWLLTRGQGLVAVLELIHEEDHLLIENIAVRADCQGQGLGRRLLALAEAAARRDGLAELRLYTNATMTANIAHYSRKGFRESRRETYKGSDIIYMRKHLIAG